MIHWSIHYLCFTLRFDRPRVQHSCGYRAIKGRTAWKANKPSITEDVWVRHEVHCRYMCRLSLDISNPEKTLIILAPVIIGGVERGLLVI